MTVYVRHVASDVAALVVPQLGVAGAAGSQGTSTQTVTVAGSPAVGDRLIFVATARSVQEAASVTWTDPTGATVVGTYEPTGGFFPRVRVWAKEDDGTASYLFGSNLNGQGCSIITLDGPGSVVSLGSGATGNSSTADPDPGSVTVGEKSLMLALCAGNTLLGGVTAPTGYTEQVDTTTVGNRGMSIASKEIASATTENPGVFTATSSTTWSALSISVAATSAA